MPESPGLPDQHPDEPEDRNARRGLSRRIALRLGAAGAAAAAVGVGRAKVMPRLRERGLANPDGMIDAASIQLTDATFTEVFPTSPLILNPFTDLLLVQKAEAPIPVTDLDPPPGPGIGQQNSFGNETHQLWTSDIGFPDPIFYRHKWELATHSFTSSQVLPIDDNGKPTQSFDAQGHTFPAGTVRTLPDSVIFSHNGQMPGPLINAEYGKPVLVRFENHLTENPQNLDTQDFGAPDFSALIHLHNGHTAPESDGNPHYAMTAGPKHRGFPPGSYVDQLYLNFPAGFDDREKVSFWWYHDHTMDHTAANVYKGLFGMYPFYDPKDGRDDGDETTGLRLPGVRTDRPDGAFDVDFDIPLAFFDVRLEDGVTLHNDFHDVEYPAAKNPRTHPEWWGKTFFRHFPDHGFVGDVFTVNGTAYPVLEVKRRKYRFRFLDASISRIYDFQLMTSTKGPKSAVSLGYGGDELQGQYRIQDGQQCMQFHEIATDGGLLPLPIVRDNFELWPAKRREVIIDFTKFMDGTPTTKGDEIYLTNVMKMKDGRMWDKSLRFSPDPNYKIPVLKFVIGDIAEDNSLIPTTPMREIPPVPSNWQSMLNDRLIFEVQRGSASGEIEWLINGKPFDPFNVLNSMQNPAGQSPPATPRKNSFGIWEIRNGGGGWVHPMHLHMEEHRTLMRNGKSILPNSPDRAHPDDISMEDLVALDPSESVVIYRGFRDFVGPYVVHCHNLMHEDHAMMFAWSIIS
ncbi:multicopper oxidase family protein [Amycolatopsis taiwanensis]|uniref:Multicopper oxidase CueO n=1 Tax=Amycolatopsis taiwanensis TaxID=342230 RepID=A0A9W6R4X9_9PSEU|nr:multicopper oxidase domain-containing protein [Amycolatopsis taiwanensis]GLY69016.1 spore coat protein A [Amycolatopsis taiwanensis]